MRDIKFRAWDSYLKKMIYEGFHIWGEVTEFDLIKQYCYENPNPEYDSSLLRANDLIFTQYTGLLDKNGKEIYEGDIVIVYEYLNGKVWVSHLHNAIIIFRYGEFTIDPCWCNQSIRQTLEVIGNIYENPELLREIK